MRLAIVFLLLAPLTGCATLTHANQCVAYSQDSCASLSGCAWSYDLVSKRGVCRASSVELHRRLMN